MTALAPAAVVDQGARLLLTIRDATDRELKTPGATPDDGPFLIYADWLNGAGGEPERSELIRAQVELARLPNCGCKMCATARHLKQTRWKSCRNKSAASLTARSAALLAAHGEDWLEPAIRLFRHNCPPPERVNIGWLVEWERGFPDTLALPLAALLPRACELCNGEGVYRNPQIRTGAAPPCFRCKGERTLPPAIDPATLARHLPALRGVRLSDRVVRILEPNRERPNGYIGGWSSCHGVPPDDELDCLPVELWRLVEGYDQDDYAPPPAPADVAQWKWFTRPTANLAIEAARLALDAAAAVWVRQA